MIVPGSVNSDGQFYEWAAKAPRPAQAPAWLLERVIRRGKVEAVKAVSGPNTRYVEAAVADELSKLTRVSRGRNNALNDASFALGTFVGAEVLTAGEAEQRLYGAAIANGYVGMDGREAALATIRSGLASGASDPRKIPEGPPETDESLVAEGGEIAERFIAAAEEKAKEAEHKEVEVSQAFVATPFFWVDPKDIPRRAWVYGEHYIRKHVSMTIAAGGAGESTLAIAEALSMVRGFPLLGDTTTEHPEMFARVWLYNGEDDRGELTRRIMAACLHYKITPTELDGKLFVDTGRERSLITHRAAGREIRIATPIIEAVKRQIITNQIDVMIVDPFVSTHAVNENDNGAINEVASTWRQIAEECNCAIEIIHHTKKIEPGRPATAADARGGSALINVARSVRELNNMSVAQAEAAGVSAEERNTIKALTFGKTNLSATPASGWNLTLDARV